MDADLESGDVVLKMWEAKVLVDPCVSVLLSVFISGKVLVGNPVALIDSAFRVAVRFP